MQIHVKYGLICLLFAIAPFSQLNAGAPVKCLNAEKLHGSISIDGTLNEPEWNSTQTANDFQQFDPVEGAEPTEKTSVRILYDDNALYVGFMCYDGEPSRISEQLTRRDRTLQSDRISVMIDSYHDHRTAFLFGGSVSGVQYDGALSNDGVDYDLEWDAVYEFAAVINDSGWSAEYRIPFSALRFVPRDSSYVWGLNFRRYIARKKETDEWVMVPRREIPPLTVSSVSRMGHLTGLNNIHPPLHLEVMPYMVSKESYLSQSPPFPLNSTFIGNAGLDLKYGLTNNFTVDMAINPDFGQVEVDKAVLNLTVFETYYPEKRPFFLEGSQIFSFGTMFDNSQLYLFYSRRIGRHPPALAPDPGFNFTDVPQTTTILGAGKISGRTNSGLTVGILSALTSEETASEEDIAGNRRPSVVLEPRTNYNVVRLRQDILGNSTLGLMATTVGEDGQTPSFNGGVDWNLRTNDGVYACDGYLAGSQATLTFGTPYSGGAGRVGIGKIQGEHWLAYSFYDFSTDRFNVDNVGFYSQPREHGGFSEVDYKEDFAPEPLRRYVLNMRSEYRWNWDNATTLRDIDINPSLEFINFWMFTVDYYHHFPAYDDYNRGVNGLYLRPAREILTTTLSTDIRKPVWLTWQATVLSTAKGMNELFNSFSFTIHPATWMEYTPSLTVTRVRSEETWVLDKASAYPVFLPDGTNLYADRDVDEYDLSLQGTLTFTTCLSLQFFMQVLLAKGQYGNFRDLAGPESLVPYDYVTSSLYANPDFNEKTINANLVLRWEYRPGSTFYLVWTQARFGDDGVFNRNLGTNFANAFRLPMDNVILAKFSYWWSL